MDVGHEHHHHNNNNTNNNNIIIIISISIYIYIYIYLRHLYVCISLSITAILIFILTLTQFMYHPCKVQNCYTKKKHPNVFKPLPVPDLPGLGLAEHNGYFSTEATQISKDRGLEH